MLGPVDGVHADDGVLDASLVVVLVLLGSHAEVEGVEGGLGEDAVVSLLVPLQSVSKLLRSDIENLFSIILKKKTIVRTKRKE